MSKKTLILGGIFIALLITAFAYDPILKWKDSLGKPDNFLSKAEDFSQIDKMEVKKDGITIILEKNDSGWKVAATKGFYVKENLINAIKDNIEKAAKDDLEHVSNNIEKKSEFNTDDSGVFVKLYSGDNLLSDFVVGKASSDYTSSYISKADISDTYLVKSNLNSVFAHSDWYDRDIFVSAADKISKIRFQYPTREFTIERSLPVSDEEDGEIGEWVGVLPYKFSVDQDEAAAILDIMTNLQAVSIPPQKFEGTGLEKHSIIIQAAGEGVDNILMIGDVLDAEAENKQYYAKKGDSDNIYLITGEQKDALDKTISDLR